MNRRPILKDFPDRIETDRLLIRAPLPGDGPELNRAVLDSLGELQTWLYRYLEGPPTVADSEALMREAHARFLLREDLWLLAFLKDTGALVASSGLHNIDWRVPKFEIGYWARTPFTGQGYVTEAVRAIRDFASTTLGARRLWIRCDVLNTRSAAVARRAGFALEATQSCDERRPDGTLRDTYVFTCVCHGDESP
jgi:RimJ/RimL family protein N-acetyltransferase